jgi:[protein-PII] uridylyltransferase
MAVIAPAQSTAADSPRLRSADWKSSLVAAREILKRGFLGKAVAAELLRRHSAVIDRHLIYVWSALDLPHGLSLLAVGGYGRGHQFPHSDIDVLILLPAPADPVLQARLSDLVGMLWDIGMEVAHSVRTIKECEELAAGDITIQTSLLEARRIAGDKALYAKFVKRMRATLDPAVFFRAKQLEQQQRHARYQATNLEPHIKESAGGLRDLQNILWIARAAGIAKTWRELAARGMLTPVEARDIQRHELFLQTLRIRLHYLAGRREDRLLFDYQSALAREMKLRDRPHRLASEQLMQLYYRTAKSVSQLNIILLQNLGAR